MINKTNLVIVFYILFLSCILYSCSDVQVDGVRKNIFEINSLDKEESTIALIEILRFLMIGRSKMLILINHVEILQLKM